VAEQFSDRIGHERLRVVDDVIHAVPPVSDAVDRTDVSGCVPPPAVLGSGGTSSAVPGFATELDREHASRHANRGAAEIREPKPGPLRGRRDALMLALAQPNEDGSRLPR
jgi:hypothetical protein